MRPDRFFQYAILFEGGLGIIALFFSILCGLNLWYGVNFGITEIFSIFIFTVPLLVCYFISVILPFESIRGIKRLIYKFFQEYMSQLTILQLAVIAIVAGLGEELFFRGLLQYGLCTTIDTWTKDTIRFGTEYWINYRLALIIIFVSILFGAAHAMTKMYFFLAFIISIYLGIIMIQTGNIIIPIAVHAIYDFFVFIVISKDLKRKENAA
ncbi:MAG: CPBP family intramembrane metalloprotease [Planctomycetaceae bacterium]|jgi:membrane protease YdiL (CAAX protease family)|nr:CPBP family intramembrane metalloprotease [Planctomycetaceae bacterium]